MHLKFLFSERSILRMEINLHLTLIFPKKGEHSYQSNRGSHVHFTPCSPGLVQKQSQALGQRCGRSKSSPVSGFNKPPRPAGSSAATAVPHNTLSRGSRKVLCAGACAAVSDRDAETLLSKATCRRAVSAKSDRGLRKAVFLRDVNYSIGNAAHGILVTTSGPRWVLEIVGGPLSDVYDCLTPGN